ncbi:MAG: hypothetical protein KGJ62_11020 [Armatimonadetes bacterium]|nr:hypothetical protein [Armatimonadota bacterium]MDE2206820.1 hypothetical protein [Armatimonadota bacterium]
MPNLPTGFRKLGQAAPILALVGAAIFAVGFMAARTDTLDQFWQAYFYGWLFWTTISLGCMLWMLVLHTVKAKFAFPVIRPFEVGATMLPLMFVLLIPILAFGLPYLYPWVNHVQVAASVPMAHRAGYMNPAWFAIRNIFYFALFGAITWLLRQSSKRQDSSGDFAESWFRSSVAAVSVVLFVLTVTLAITDWVMSLDPLWFSTIYGFLWCDYAGLGAMALICAMVGLQSRGEPYRSAMDYDVTRDLGNLLFLFIMVWGYFSFSQWIIVWSGNLPHEIHYFLIRNQGQLLPLGAFIVVGEFFVPFIALLSSRLKRTPRMLAGISLWILMMRVLELHWVVMPMWHPYVLNVTALEVGAWLAFAGIWFTAFSIELKRAGVVPRHATAVMEVAQHA